MSKITSIEGRILFNSRGSKTIEVDVKSDSKFLGRVCAPSGASVGKYEATSFPNGNGHLASEFGDNVLNNGCSSDCDADSIDAIVTAKASAPPITE